MLPRQFGYKLQLNYITIKLITIKLQFGYKLQLKFGYNCMLQGPIKCGRPVNPPLWDKSVAKLANP